MMPNSMNVSTVEEFIREYMRDAKLYAIRNEWDNYIVVLDRDGCEVASLERIRLLHRDFRSAILYIERQVRDYKWTRDIWSGRKHVCL